jgi:hypothetical protein
MLNTNKMRKLAHKYFEGMSTHWTYCEYEHLECAVLALCDEVDRLKQIIKDTREIYEKPEE